MSKFLAYLVSSSGAITAHFVKNESELDVLIGCPRITRGITSSDLRRIIGVSNHEMITHCVWFSDLNDPMVSKLYDTKENELASRLIGRRTHGACAIMALDVANSVCNIDPKFVESKLQETATV